MGYKLTTKDGSVIAKILQFVATDQQVNNAITKYLDENGISLAEGVDLKTMAQNIEKNASDITGLKTTVEGIGKSTTNILLEYQDHFFSEWERGYIDNISGENTGDLAYVRSKAKKIYKGDTILISGCPTGYMCSFYFYDETGKFQGASSMYAPDQYYKIQDSQIGWTVKAVVYAQNIDTNEINIIMAGSVISKLLEQVQPAAKNILGEEELSSEDILEMNVTKASLKTATNANTALVAFLTDLHITCPAEKTAEEIAKLATKIRRQLATYNMISAEYPVDLCVYGGDYLNNSSQTNKETATEALKAVRMLIDQTEGAPIIIAKGNHDDNTMHTDYKDGYIPIEVLYDLLSGKDNQLAVRNTDQIEMSYGYYDIPNKKLRIFVLNTLDIPTSLDESTNKLEYSAQNDSGFRQEQIQFVADNLKITEKGWQVMFFCHHPFVSFAKEDAESAETTAQPGKMTGKGEIVQVAHGSQAMLDVIEGFKNGTKGTVTNTTKDFETSVEYDFTKNGSNTVIACIYGHTHVFYHHEYNGIHHIAARAVLGHPTFNFISTGNYFVIDRKNRKFKLIANGDGDDYEFEY